MAKLWETDHQWLVVTWGISLKRFIITVVILAIAVASLYFAWRQYRNAQLEGIYSRLVGEPVKLVEFQRVFNGIDRVRLRGESGKIYGFILQYSSIFNEPLQEGEFVEEGDSITFPVPGGVFGGLFCEYDSDCGKGSILGGGLNPSGPNYQRSEITRQYFRGVWGHVYLTSNGHTVELIGIAMGGCFVFAATEADKIEFARLMASQTSPRRSSNPQFRLSAR